MARRNRRTERSSRRDTGSKAKRDRKRNDRRSRRFQKDALMNRMHQSQQQAEGGTGVIKPDADVTIWRPKEGFHTIDIIPYEVGKYNVDGDEPGAVHYCFRYFFHRGVGPANKWVICPLKTWGNDCPICEERQRLIDNNADWDKVIKPLFPRERYLYNIVCYDRGEEKKGVQVWDVSNHYFQKHIIKLSKKPARHGREEKQVLFFDEEEGKSITFTIEPPQSKEDFAEYVAHAFEDREGYTITDDILDQAKCLDEIVEIYSYDELAKMFFGRSERKDRGGTCEIDDEESGEVQDMLDELDDIQDNEELIEFCEDNSLDVKLSSLPRRFNKNIDTVREVLEEMLTDAKDSSDGDDDDGGGGDYTADDIDAMSLRQLKRLIKDEDLDIDPKDFDDDDDLRDEIIDFLGLEDD